MGLQLRSPSHQIRVIDYTHSAATTAKTPVVISSRAYIPHNTKGVSEQNAYVYESEVSGAPKATGEAWALGQAIYWDAAAGKFTTTSTSNTLCGRSLGAALAGDTESPLFLFNAFA